MTQASAGMETSLPTARMTPRATTTVASSSGAPETGTTFAPRIAKYCGSPPCGKAGGLNAKEIAATTTPASADKPMRSRVERMPELLMETRRLNDRPSVIAMDARGYWEVSSESRRLAGDGNPQGNSRKIALRLFLFAE